MAVTEGKEAFIEILKETRVLQFGTFTLASGATSNYYIDLRLLPSFPRHFFISCKIGAEIIAASLKEKPEAIVGIPMAGVPFATILGQILDLPVFLLRSSAKAYGKKKRLEGAVTKGSKILLVDDVITSGGSKVTALETLKSEGLVPVGVFVFVDRRETDKNTFEDEQGIPLLCILDYSDIKPLIGQ